MICLTTPPDMTVGTDITRFFLDCLTFKRKALQSFKTLVTICPTTRHHIPETPNLQNLTLFAASFACV